jgi:ribonucleotide reductase alpha subunit
MQFDTTINDWHTCPNTARINASNPCSEYMFLDDTACNLASLNLMKFVRRGRRVRRRELPRRLPHVITAQEIVVDNASYPTKAIEKNSPRLPSAGPRLRQPRRAADGSRACRTTPTPAAPTPAPSPRS